MPTTIDTGNNIQPAATQAFNERKVDRCQDGTLWAVFGGTNASGTGAVNSAAEFHYSKDNGATWTFAPESPVGATFGSQYASSLFIDVDDYAHFVWKQNGNEAGRTNGYLYYMRGTPNAGRTAWTWSTALLLFNDSSGDVPDVVAARTPGASTWDAFCVWSSAVSSPNNRAYYSRIRIAADGAFSPSTDGLSGSATWGYLSNAYSVNAHTYPSIDFNHDGGGKIVAGGTPHLYVGWRSGLSASALRFRKAVYSGGSWTWNAEQTLTTTESTPYGTNWHVTMFDGTRAVTAGFFASASDISVQRIVLYDRDAADTTTTRTVLLTTSGDTSPLQDGSASYDSAGNVYLFGRDNSGSNGTRKLNYRKWTRVGASLGAITTFDSSGNDTPYISAKRGYSSSSIEWVWTDGTTSPYSVQFDRVALTTTGLYVPAMML